MNRFLLALLLLAPCASYAQDNPDYDPDYNDDGCYAIQDVLGLLPLFGTCPDTTTNWACGDTLLYDGYWYETVQIGNQCWFAENLRAEHYANGVEIPSNLDLESSITTLSGAMNVFGDGGTWCYSPSWNIIDACNTSESLELYGRLYNWMAVDDPRGLCPQGWRVGSGTDWTILENHVLAQGLELEIALRSANGWTLAAPLGTDDYGFSLLPAGARGWNGNFSGAGTSANLWTSTLNTDGAEFRIFYPSSSMTSTTDLLYTGKSVRCILTAPVIGCTDPNFLEYDPLATINNGSCVNPQIGGCTDENYFEFNPLANIDDGSCTIPAMECTPPSMDGHTYSTTQIGTQCWFAENLRTTEYADGTNIPEITGDTAWVLTTEGARCNFNNDSSTIDDFGRLYNWHATIDNRGLCPVGWHVPTDSEWLVMESFIGIPEDELYSYWDNDRGKSVAFKLRDLDPALGSLMGIDEFGFSFRRGASRYGETIWEEPWGTWFWDDGTLWTSTGNGVFGINRSIGSRVTRNIDLHEKVNGLSVRCIQDPIIPGCTDSTYLEYNLEATVDDGSCTTPVILGCTNEYYAEYAPDANQDDGSCNQLLNPCTSPSMDGYSYAVVSIGWQCWFAENLKTRIYSNGDTITSNLSNDEWENSAEGAWCSYGQGDADCIENSPESNSCNDSLAMEQYGLLYNRPAINDERGICPSGWAIPTWDDWQDLLNINNTGTFWQPNTAWALKSSTGWHENGNGLDSYGFHALPAGGRAKYSGDFFGAGIGAYFPLYDDCLECHVQLSAFTDNIPYAYMELSGMSVRCIKIND